MVCIWMKDQKLFGPSHGYMVAHGYHGNMVVHEKPDSFKTSHLLLCWRLFRAFFNSFQKFAEQKLYVVFFLLQYLSLGHKMESKICKVVPGQLNNSRELVEKRCKLGAENQIQWMLSNYIYRVGWRGRSRFRMKMIILKMPAIDVGGSWGFGNDLLSHMEEAKYHLSQKAGWSYDVVRDMTKQPLQWQAGICCKRLASRSTFGRPWTKSVSSIWNDSGRGSRENVALTVSASRSASSCTASFIWQWSWTMYRKWNSVFPDGLYRVFFHWYPP